MASKKSGTIVLVYSYMGRFLLSISRLVVMPYFLSLQQLGIIAGICESLVLLGKVNIYKSVIRYGTGVKEENKKTIFLFFILSTTLFYLFVFFFLYLFKKPILHLFFKRAPQFATYAPFLFIGGYFSLLAVTLKAWNIANGNIVWSNFLQHIILPLPLPFLAFLYGMGKISFAQLAQTATLLYAIPVLGTVGKLAQNIKWSEKINTKLLSPTFLSNFFSFSSFTFLATSLSLIINRVDNIMILGMCGEKNAGIYKIASFLGTFLIIPFKTMKQEKTPTIVKMVKEKDKKIDAFYKQNIVRQLFYTCSITAFIYFNVNLILFSFSKEAAEKIRFLFIIIALTKFFEIMALFSSEILLLSQYYIFSFASSLTLPIGILLNYFFIKKIGMAGAALSTILLVVAIFIYNTLLLQKKLAISPFSTELFILTFSFFALFLFYHLFHYHKTSFSWLSFILKNTTIFLFCCINKKKIVNQTLIQKKV